ncbi:MAG: RNA methyltransferase [Deltaproteobacteria bacterium HGW-Deltaproteobacteria-22]|nr:MAG: RNA methyltransferase [Deltaproteobacteria bacterium HGW-Deltaproteobacteria-22]
MSSNELNRPPYNKKKPPNSAPEFLLGLTSAELDRLNTSGRCIPYRDIFRVPISPEVGHWSREHGLLPRSLVQLACQKGHHSTKYLFGLHDGHAIESVLIPRHDGNTACISSQVGCAFACRFCASGRLGLKRNLLVAEMVEQVLLMGPRVNRIVFMGVGEPLANYRAVLATIRILRDRRGLDWSTGGITISSIGPPDALRRLREEHVAIHLTISLHATTQETRGRLIPGVRHIALDDVIGRAQSWADRHRRDVSYAYLVLPGINDSQDDARRLAGFLAGQRARVNLLRWNPVDGVSLPRTTDRSLARMIRTMEASGVPVSVRDTLGRDNTSACGQLWIRAAVGV